MKPRPPGLTDTQYVLIALKEGYALLEADEKKKHSVKSPAVSKVQDALGKMSNNPYVRARTQLLEKMLPGARAVIEKMEAGTLTKDPRYDMFCREVASLGDKLSSQN